jgi:hypothetical protein
MRSDLKLISVNSPTTNLNEHGMSVVKEIRATVMPNMQGCSVYSAMCCNISGIVKCIALSFWESMMAPLSGLKRKPSPRSSWKVELFLQSSYLAQFSAVKLEAAYS